MDDLTFLQAQYVERALVFGHQGARAYAPSNTLPSFELAAAQGADGVELDVWLSKDGHLVVIHDDTVDATTDGTGSVQDMTLAELKSLDAGTWYNPRYAGTRIPTLDEVFDTVGRRVIVNVEIKTLEDNRATSNGIERTVADCITRHGLQDRVVVSSFSLATLKRFRAIVPHVAIGFLYATFDALGDQFVRQCEYLHPYHELLTPEYIEQLPPLPLNTWTVNEPDRMDALLEMGVRGLITDKPDVARKVVDAQRA
jgi:glycerophosphoryl diester phosphodiesterase